MGIFPQGSGIARLEQAQVILTRQPDGSFVGEADAATVARLDLTSADYRAWHGTVKGQSVDPHRTPTATPLVETMAHFFGGVDPQREPIRVRVGETLSTPHLRAHLFAGGSTGRLTIPYAGEARLTASHAAGGAPTQNSGVYSAQTRTPSGQGQEIRVMAMATQEAPHGEVLASAFLQGVHARLAEASAAGDPIDARTLYQAGLAATGYQQRHWRTDISDLPADLASAGVLVVIGNEATLITYGGCMLVQRRPDARGQYASIAYSNPQHTGQDIAYHFTLSERDTLTLASPGFWGNMTEVGDLASLAPPPPRVGAAPTDLPSASSPRAFNELSAAFETDTSQNTAHELQRRANWHQSHPGRSVQAGAGSVDMPRSRDTQRNIAVFHYQHGRVGSVIASEARQSFPTQQPLHELTQPKAPVAASPPPTPQGQWTLNVGRGSSAGYTIGSDPGCDIVIPGLAPRHARLAVVRGGVGWTVTPIGNAVTLQIRDGGGSYRSPTATGTLLLRGDVLDLGAIQLAYHEIDHGGLAFGQITLTDASRLPEFFPPPPPPARVPAPPVIASGVIPAQAGTHDRAWQSPTSSPAPRPADLTVNALAGDTVVTLDPRRANIVGTHTVVEVPLTGTGIADRHARIDYEGDRWVIAPLGPQDLVEVNGVRIQGTTVLNPRDRINIGDRRMHFVVEGGEPKLRVQAPGASQGLAAWQPLPLLRVHEFTLDPAVKRVCRIGRDPDSEIQIEDPEISPIHAQIEREADDSGWRLVATDWAGNTSLNGTRIDPQNTAGVRIEPNDRIELGRRTFVLIQNITADGSPQLIFREFMLSSNEVIVGLKSKTVLRGHISYASNGQFDFIDSATRRSCTLLPIDILTIAEIDSPVNATLNQQWIRVPLDKAQFRQGSYNQSGINGDGMMTYLDYRDPEVIRILTDHIEPLYQDLQAGRINKLQAAASAREIIRDQIVRDAHRANGGDIPNRLYSLGEFKRGVCNERAMWLQVALQYLGIESRMEKGEIQDFDATTDQNELFRHAWVHVTDPDIVRAAHGTVKIDPSLGQGIYSQGSDEFNRRQNDDTPFARTALHHP